MDSELGVVERLVELIGASAVPVDRLAEELGMSVRELRFAVQLDGRFGALGESLVYTPALLDGTVWVVPIDPDDAAADDTVDEAPGGFVRAQPHLAALSWWVVTHPIPLLDDDGNEIDRLGNAGAWIDEREIDVIHGDDGWLDGIGPWAAFHVASDGIRVVSLDQPPAPDPQQAAALAAAYSRVAEERDSTGFGGTQLSPRFASLVTLLDDALVHDGDAFRTAPIAPVAELLAAAGLELRDSLVAEAGFDWDELRAWQNRNRLRTYYDLTDDQIDGLTMITGACELFGETGRDALGSTEEEQDGALKLFAAILDDADLSSAFLQETQNRGIGFHTIAELADAIGECVVGTELDTAGVAWLRSLCADARGDWSDAIRIIDEAVDERTTHPLALIEAAFIAADRSQPARTRQLLARAGVGADDDERLPPEALRLVDEISPFTSRRGRSDVGRNDPCPCGSGRKYKVCHLGKETLTLDERAPWLYEKASRHVRISAPDIVEGTAMDLADHAPDYYDSLVDLPFVMDVVLHEVGLWSEFVDRRGELLPDDERELAAVWPTVPRAVYAVESTRGGAAGGELRLRNVATDEIVVVSGVHVDDRLEGDQLLVGRPLPVGDTWRSMSGFFPLAAGRADDVIAAIAAGDSSRMLDLLAEELTLE